MTEPPIPIDIHEAWLRLKVELEMLLGDWFHKLHMRRTAYGWYGRAGKTWRRAGQYRARSKTSNTCTNILVNCRNP
jgi:hypothetical protein